MNTSMPTAKPLNWLAGLCGLALLMTASGCGPVYVQDRDDGYYSNQTPPPQPGYQQPAPQQPVVDQQYAAQSGQQPQQYFNDLGSYGAWNYTPEYGTVWIPYANRTAGWRPYFYGSWVYTDWGWTWQSDEAWGSGPYHYGRWVWLPGSHWAWIPGYTWGPAWVVWGSGGGCVGWAPLGPAGYSEVRYHQSYWTYVPENRVYGHRVQEVVISPSQVPGVYSQTVVMQPAGQIRGHDGTVVAYNRGPDPGRVQQWTQRPVEPRRVDGVPGAQPRQIPATAADPVRQVEQNARRPDPNAGRTPEGQQGRPGESQPGVPAAGRPGESGVPAGRGGEVPPASRPGEPGIPAGRGGEVPPASRPGQPAAGRPGATEPPPSRPAVDPARPTTPAPQPTRPQYEPPPSRPAEPVHPTTPAPQPTRPQYEPPPSRPAEPTRPSTPAPAPTRPQYEPPSRPSQPNYGPDRDPNRTPMPQRPMPEPARPVPPAYRPAPMPIPPPNARPQPAPQRPQQQPAPAPARRR